MSSENLWGLTIVLLFLFLLFLWKKEKERQNKFDCYIVLILVLLNQRDEEKGLNELEISMLTDGMISEELVIDILEPFIRARKIFWRKMPHRYKTPEGDIVFVRYLFWGKEEKPDST